MSNFTEKLAFLTKIGFMTSYLFHIPNKTFHTLSQHIKHQHQSRKTSSNEEKKMEPQRVKTWVTLILCSDKMKSNAGNCMNACDAIAHTSLGNG